MKIFVSAYACEPGLGSEIGVGWHWVQQMARAHQLWVLTRESNRARIEAYYRDHPEAPAVNWVYFDLPRWARRWKKGLRGVRIYYNIWTRLSDRLVREVMERNRIQVFHHLTYGNAMWPVSAYGSRAHFVWGPVGGLETIPSQYSCRYTLSDRIRELLRRVLVWRTRHSYGFRKRCRRASMILCKTEITRESIPAKYQHKALLFTDVAPEKSAPECIRRSGAAYTLLAVGRLEGWRGFDLAIEALAKASCRDAVLVIVGKGPDRRRLASLAGDLGVTDRVVFTGGVDMERYRKLLSEASAVINPALKEGAVTVAFDTIPYGKPLIALDTTGYTRYFDDSHAVIIPRSSRPEVIAGMAAAIDRLSDPALRENMGVAARKALGRYTWDSHGREINSLFEDDQPTD